MAFKSQNKLIEEAVRQSGKIFPDGENYSTVYAPKCGRNYFYFPGIHYFRHQTITPDMIEKLQSGGNMLSVGSGDGHLERLISQGFNVPKNRIVVSDIKLDPNLKGMDFKSYEFDMTLPWPALDENFDYILFPQSLGVALLLLEGNRTYRFTEEIESDAKRIIKGEKPVYPEIFIGALEMDAPVISKTYAIMEEAISNLKPEGEIRVCNGVENDQQKAYLMYKLRKKYPSIMFPPPDDGENFSIKIS